MPKRRSSAVSLIPTWSIADVEYDPATHTSKLPDGTPVPHVTGVLCAVGVTENFDELAGRSDRLAASIEFARARGTAVHADCHAYDDDDLHWPSVDERIKPWVEAWAEARAALGIVPLERERRLFHPLHRYTGIKDGIFARGAKRILIDIKTGDPKDAAGHLQTAAYAEAERAVRPDFSIDERWAVRLVPGMKVPYRVTNYTDRPDAYMDLLKFLACLTVYREQPKNRRA